MNINQQHYHSHTKHIPEPQQLYKEWLIGRNWLLHTVTQLWLRLLHWCIYKNWNHLYTTTQRFFVMQLQIVFMHLSVTHIVQQQCCTNLSQALRNTHWSPHFHKNTSRECSDFQWASRFLGASGFGWMTGGNGLISHSCHSADRRCHKVYLWQRCLRKEIDYRTHALCYCT